jgi:hypothetical protein
MLNTTNEYNHATHVMSTKVESNQKWMMFSKFWSCYNETQDQDEINPSKMNQVFANRSEEEAIYPLAVKEIVAAQKADPVLKHYFKRNAVLEKGVELQLVENESCICRNTEAIATARNDVVSPLSSAPRTYPSRRDNESRNILERNAYHHPIHNEVMQDLPNK